VVSRRVGLKSTVIYRTGVGELLRFESDFGTVYVEERDDSGLERVGLLSRAKPAKEKLEVALAQVRPAFQAAIAALGELAVPPEEFEIEVGLTLTAEAGALIARTAAEGHLVVRAVWRPTTAGRDSGAGRDSRAGRDSGAGRA